MNRINSIDDIQCGRVCRVPLELEIEYFEKRLIPMIEEYGEAEMNLKLDEVKQELEKMKKRFKLGEKY